MRFVRVWDHLISAARGAAEGPGSSALPQLTRYTSKGTAQAPGTHLTPLYYDRTLVSGRLMSVA